MLCPRCGAVIAEGFYCVGKDCGFLPGFSLVSQCPQHPGTWTILLLKDDGTNGLYCPACKDWHEPPKTEEPSQKDPPKINLK